MTIQQLEEIVQIEEERLQQTQEVLEELRYFIQRLKDGDFEDNEEKSIIFEDILSILEENGIEY
tara:strand:+ start:202 stop:393 length:192 start_codon:yes stop_codon:yes gene_type:complete